MLDTELLIPLAEIAGVFVGFGALIAVRSSGPTEATEVSPMRMVVSLGMLAVAGGLVPGTLGRFDLPEHAVWALSSAVILAGWVAILVASARTPEYRAYWAEEIEATRGPSRQRWSAVLQDFVLTGIYMLAALLIPIVILLGVAPDLEAALYYAVVVLILLGAGWALLGLVFAQRPPAKAASA